MVSTLEQMQVPSGTGPGVRRSKRPLLASRTRCNVLWKPPKFGNKVKIGIKVEFGNKFANRCNVWSIEGVIVYGHIPECHVTFGRGRLHNVWWDPHIDHKTSWGTISNDPWHLQITSKLLKQGYRYHKLRKTFGKFFRSYSELLSKFGDISFQEYVF